MQALFLISPTQIANDNHEVIPRGFKAAGWEVVIAPHDSLAMVDGHLVSDGNTVQDFDLVWPMGLGPHRSYLDRVQLLAGIEPQKITAPSINQMHLHSKTAWLEFAPPSCVGASADSLLGWAELHDGPWVLKPTAGSFGRGVELIEDRGALEDRLIRRATEDSGYWLLQRFVPEIAQGETRALIACGEILGVYRRTPESGFKANLSQTGIPTRTDLTPAEREQLVPVLEILHANEIKFAAIDLCGGYVLEVNVANPGGLSTMADLYEQDLTGCLVELFSERLADPAQKSTP